MAVPPGRGGGFWAAILKFMEEKLALPLGEEELSESKKTLVRVLSFQAKKAIAI